MVAQDVCHSAVWASPGPTREVLPARANEPILDSTVIRTKATVSKAMASRSRNMVAEDLKGTVTLACHKEAVVVDLDTVRRVLLVAGGRFLSASRRSQTRVYSLV